MKLEVKCRQLQKLWARNNCVSDITGLLSCILKNFHDKELKIIDKLKIKTNKQKYRQFTSKRPPLKELVLKMISQGQRLKKGW